MMGHSLKGDVTFKARGGTWVLRFGVNELCVLEDELDLGIHEIGVLLKDERTVRQGLVRAIFWAGLSESNPLSLDEAGRLMSELGQDRVNELINRAFSLAFPPTDPKGGAAHPPMSQRDATGSNFSAPGEGSGLRNPTSGGAPRAASWLRSGIKKLC